MASAHMAWLVVEERKRRREGRKRRKKREEKKGKEGKRLPRRGGVAQRRRPATPMALEWVDPSEMGQVLNLETGYARFWTILESGPKPRSFAACAQLVIVMGGLR